jgi:hypothetical protein
MISTVRINCTLNMTQLQFSAPAGRWLRAQVANSLNTDSAEGSGRSFKQERDSVETKIGRHVRNLRAFGMHPAAQGGSNWKCIGTAELRAEPEACNAVWMSAPYARLPH